jgi:hypothetical protein
MKVPKYQLSIFQWESTKFEAELTLEARIFLLQDCKD